MEQEGSTQLTLPQTVRLDSKKIKAIREERGLTQLYVATVVGVTIDTISRWENKKYPSVKRENAIKLAQTLEVDVEEILEQDNQQSDNTNEREDASNEQAKEVATEREVARKDISKRLFILALFAGILFGIGGLILGYFLFRPSSSSIEIDAMRLLPVFCAPASLFPVVIQVNITPAAKRTILIKEDIPRVLKVEKGVPKYTSLEKGLLKWIYQGDSSDLKFVYIAKMPNSVNRNKRLKFKGTVTIKKREQTVSAVIGGAGHVTPSPFHWADRNGDNKIDDDEILNAYQLLSGVKGMTRLLREVEALWAAGSYTWDKDSKQFVPEKKH